MKLSSFIKAQLDQILVEWDLYARTLFVVPPPHWILRDHAREILLDLTLDMEVPQSHAEQIEKSRGQALEDVDRNSAAAVHGQQRQTTGFTLIQLTSEYRALRATVLRLWLPQIAIFDAAVLADVTRFHEAIDHALADSVVTYSESADKTRDTFLAILGHDLRGPLSTMTMAGTYLARQINDDDSLRQLGRRVLRSTASMTSMVNDLLEYARSQIGASIPLAFSQTDIRSVCHSAVEQAEASYPDCPFTLKAEGDTIGLFDGPKLQQLVSNLLNNAAQYRSAADPVTLTVQGDAGTVTLRVGNKGPVIPEESLQAIFDPLIQLPTAAQSDQTGAPASSLGLGLFIAREITTAHGGSIKAESSEQSGTVFIVSLPKHGPAAEENAVWNGRTTGAK